MKRILPITFLMLIGCSTLSKIPDKTEYGFRVKQVESTFDRGLFKPYSKTFAGVEYTPIEIVRSEDYDRCRKKMYSHEECQDRIDALNTGGWLYLTTSASDITTANPENWEFIIEVPHEGVVQRENGDNNVPDFSTIGDVTTWYSSFSFFLEKDYKHFRVHCVHNSGNKMVFEVSEI